MVCHETFKTENKKWINPSEVIKEGEDFLQELTEKKSKFFVEDQKNE